MLIYELEGFRVDPQSRQLSKANGSPIIVRAKVFDTLLYLLERAGRPVEKAELLKAVWPHAVVEENNLNQTISALRSILGDSPQLPRFIATLTGRGYQFIGKVSVVAVPSVESSAAADPSPPLDPSRPVDPVRPADSLQTSKALPSERRLRPSVRQAFAAAAVVAVAAAILLWREGLIPSDSSEPLAAPAPRLFASASELASDFPGSHRQPTLSPDGTMMAFASDASGTWQIWIDNLADGDPRQITPDPEGAAWPSWSPRGDQILFHRLARAGFSIWSIDPLGTREPRMLIERGSTPSFSPDGAAFVYQGPNREIWIARSDGSERRKIDGVPSGPGFVPRLPAFSADGGSIIFVHAEAGPYGDLWTIPAAGGEARQLTFQGGIDELMGTPASTADGFVVFAAAPGMLRSGGHLWRVPLEGGRVEQITTGVGGYSSPVVSRDGSRMLYAYARPVWRLMRTELTTLASTPLYESRTPIVRPAASYDGRTIAYFSELQSGVHVLTIGADGADWRQRTFDTAGVNTLPEWSHDGSIYFYKDRALHRLPADGMQSVEVLPDFHWSSRNYLAVHVEKIAFHEFFSRTERRTIIKDLATGAEIELPGAPVNPMQWSKDGTELLGFRSDSTIVICAASGARCETVANEGEPVRGSRPRWSLDETRIFFARSAASSFYATLWVVDRDGTNAAELFELGPFERDSVRYAVVADNAIVWNQFEQTPSEIWMSSTE